MLWLLLLGQLGKGGLGLHELAHKGSGMGLHNGGEQGLLAGEVAVEGPGGHPGVLHDLPQGCPLKSFVKKFLHGSLLYALQSGAYLFFHIVSPHDTVI